MDLPNFTEEDFRDTTPKGAAANQASFSFAAPSRTNPKPSTDTEDLLAQLQSDKLDKSDHLKKSATSEWRETRAENRKEKAALAAELDQEFLGSAVAKINTLE